MNEALLTAVHGQPTSVVRLTPPGPPADAAGAEDPLSAYVHVAAACVMVAATPAIVMVPILTRPVGLAATV